MIGIRPRTMLNARNFMTVVKFVILLKIVLKKKNEAKEKGFEDRNNALVHDKTKTKNGLVLVSVEQKLSDEWILDSGCSFHMCPNKNYFIGFEKNKREIDYNGK